MRPEPISSGLHQRTKTKVIIDKPSSLDSAEDPPEPGTMEPRKAQVHDQELDWAFLRSRGLLPGGFGVERAEIWPKLLNARRSRSPSSSATLSTDNEGGIKNPQENLDSASDAESTSHPDEHQIKLDTQRSFVLYHPVDSMKDKDTLQEELHDLIVSVFRKRPKLRYFQGYHDIITVFFLTLPKEDQLICAEKLSLHRVRDSMGTGLEPVLGLLQVMKKLLRVVDRSYADILEQTAPLPFYALSNLLTLFSHDMPTLELNQHVFDYLLCRPPITVVYLATAIILCRKEEVVQLEREGDDGMIHSLLSSLPEIVDGFDENEAGDLPLEPNLERNPEHNSQAQDAGVVDGAPEAPLAPVLHSLGPHNDENADIDSGFVQIPKVEAIHPEEPSSSAASHVDTPLAIMIQDSMRSHVITTGPNHRGGNSGEILPGVAISHPTPSAIKPIPTQHQEVIEARIQGTTGEDVSQISFSQQSTPSILSHLVSDNSPPTEENDENHPLANPSLTEIINGKPQSPLVAEPDSQRGNDTIPSTTLGNREPHVPTGAYDPNSANSVDITHETGASLLREKAEQGVGKIYIEVTQSSNNGFADARLFEPCLSPNTNTNSDSPTFASDTTVPLDAIQNSAERRMKQNVDVVPCSPLESSETQSESAPASATVVPVDTGSKDVKDNLVHVGGSDHANEIRVDARRDSKNNSEFVDDVSSKHIRANGIPIDEEATKGRGGDENGIRAHVVHTKEDGGGKDGILLTASQSHPGARISDQNENDVVQIDSNVGSKDRIQAEQGLEEKSDDGGEESRIFGTAIPGSTGYPSGRRRRTTPAAMPLSSLLTQADALYAQYPPSLPQLKLSSIMGPQSVVYTWSEKEADLPSDATAEAMVLHPDLIVYNYMDVGEEEEEEEATGYDTEKDKERDEGSEDEGEGWTVLSGGRSARSKLGKAWLGLARGSRQPFIGKQAGLLGLGARGTAVTGVVLILAVVWVWYGPK